MKRVVVRVYLGDAKAKGSPIAQAIGFLGSAVGPPAVTVADWTAGTTPTPAAPGAGATGTAPPGATPVIPVTPTPIKPISPTP